MSEIRKQCYSLLCKNKSPSLSLNEKTGWYYCFRCGLKGREKQEDPKVLLFGKKERKEFERPPINFNLKKKHYNYLESVRDISPFVLESVPMRSTMRGILFPFPTIPGYWQMRNEDFYSPPRWRNSKAPIGPKEGVAYVLHSFDPGFGIAFVEGVGDALKVAGVVSTIATLSKTIHEAQVLSVAHLYDKAYYIPDSDVPIDEALQNYNYLSTCFEDVKWIKLETGDPGSTDLKTLCDLMGEDSGISN